MHMDVYVNKRDCLLGRKKCAATHTCGAYLFLDHSARSDGYLFPAMMENISNAMLDDVSSMLDDVSWQSCARITSLKLPNPCTLLKN